MAQEDTRTVLVAGQCFNVFTKQLSWLFMTSFASIIQAQTWTQYSASSSKPMHFTHHGAWWGGLQHVLPPHTIPYLESKCPMHCTKPRTTLSSCILTKIRLFGTPSLILCKFCNIVFSSLSINTPISELWLCFTLLFY